MDRETQYLGVSNTAAIIKLVAMLLHYMVLLHLKMTSFSDLNTAIPLRCPFHALAIVQVGFAGAKIFCAPSFSF